MAVGPPPALVPPGVEELHADGRSLLGAEVGQRLQRYEAPPAPPAEVQARTSRRTRSGCRIATSWATMPPKETPNTRQWSQRRASSSAAASSAKSAMA